LGKLWHEWKLNRKSRAQQQATTTWAAGALNLHEVHVSEKSCHASEAAAGWLPSTKFIMIFFYLVEMKTPSRVSCLTPPPELRIFRLTDFSVSIFY